VIDKNGYAVIDSNSKIVWNSLKNIPESNGVDVWALAQAAWDGLQTLYDVYDALKGLVSPQPKLPDEIKDPLSDALGSNDNGTSNIYVD
jgi:hypothetical protein